MIEELGSVGDAWRDALSRVEFERPDAEFRDSLIHKIDGSWPRPAGIDTSTGFALGIAVRMLCAQQEDGTARQLVQAMIDHRERLLDIALDPGADITLQPIEAALNTAAAQTVLQAAAPDRAILRRLVCFFIERFPRKRSLHSSFSSRLLASAYAAWLLQDLDLLQELTSLRTSVGEYPLQWPFLRNVAKRSRTETVDGVSYLRCDDESARREFLRFFRSNRWPFPSQRPPELGREAVLMGPNLGAYYFSWLYLQTFAPTPVRQTDWGVLRELMMG